MIPLHDNVRSRRTPYVNYGMIAVCTLVFLAQQSTAGELIYELGMVPRRVFDGDAAVPLLGATDFFGRPLRAPDSWVPGFLTPFSCMFLHGGWLHFGFNMWSLYIFGDNVEDRLGHGRYLGFYLLCGVLASLAHLLTDPGSVVPTIGASGAIAGVMGAYMLLYPRAEILTLVPIFIIFYMVVLPAWLMIGFWFATQLLQGLVTLGAGVDLSGGVAFWAHIGGFVAGYLLARRWRERARLHTPTNQPRRTEERIPTYYITRRRR